MKGLKNNFYKKKIKFEIFNHFIQYLFCKKKCLLLASLDSKRSYCKGRMHKEMKD